MAVWDKGYESAAIVLSGHSSSNLVCIGGLIV